jgi:hypothetical protein
MNLVPMFGTLLLGSTGGTTTAYTATTSIVVQ